MRVYLKNNPAKFHPDPVWNDGALGFYEERCRNKNNNKKKNNNKMCSDMGSVPSPKMTFTRQRMWTCFDCVPWTNPSGLFLELAADI